ncbi:hypothetical protein HZU38_16380 [Mycolicibacterium vanbaalenii]|nr:hypothetical protein [Mycolicibacterium vanbaalenii]UJL26579.1 hypothetical protein HZU38_16380 [Mycolicibacterium vanbaalenii]WND58679.1 hypothetical protein QQA43_09985 [Mycolicibacterium vanbaalenii]
MATAVEAREWARGALRGIGDSLYTPLGGADGDDIDWAGWLRDGIVCPAQLGTAGYLFETPDRPIYSEYWELIVAGELLDAMDYARESGLDQFDIDMGAWFTCYPGRPDYFTHWGGAFKFAASVLGLPIGSYPHSRPPQAELPALAQNEIRVAYRNLGLVG